MFDPESPISAELEVSFGRRLLELADSFEDAIALIFVASDGSEQSYSWRQLERRSNQVARAMSGRGVAAGDMVALAVPNSPGLIEAVLATWKLGAIPVPVRWDLPNWECERVLAAIGASLSISAEELSWLSSTSDLDDTALDDRTSPFTNGICSSGSTGTPKVILVARPATWTEASSSVFVDSWMNVSRPQTVLVPTALYHTNGFASLFTLLAGDRLVVLERFDAALALDAIERHGVSTFTATPTMLQRMTDLPDIASRDFSSLEWVLQGAAVIPPSLVEKWCELLGPERFFIAYGMTEGLGLAALRGDEWFDHRGSVGRGFRGTEIRVLGPDGNDLPTGEIGEIYLRSPMAGQYLYRGGAQPLPVTPDGFSTVGDLGRLDEDGFLYIADRRVDMIITGGANVFPAEVESALIDHPGIRDVVVIGLTDTHWGRRVHAIVEPTDFANPPDAESVRTFAKGRLAAYKVPKTVEIIDRIPRSAATKVSRTALVNERGG